MNSDISNGDTVILFTDHARRRGQARGIKMLSAELATRFGKKRRVKGGRFQRLFTKQSMNRAREAGVAPQDIEVAVGVPVIVDEHVQGTRKIISILPKTRLRRSN